MEFRMPPKKKPSLEMSKEFRKMVPEENKKPKFNLEMSKEFREMSEAPEVELGAPGKAEEPSWLDKFSQRVAKNEKGDIELPESLKPLADKLKPMMSNFKKNEERFGKPGATPTAEANDGGLSKAIMGQDWSYRPKQIKVAELNLGEPGSSSNAKLMALRKLMGLK